MTENDNNYKSAYFSFACDRELYEPMIHRWESGATILKLLSPLWHDIYIQLFLYLFFLSLLKEQINMLQEKECTDGGGQQHLYS